ncbi:MAG TPA: ribosome-associated translation inhibitor RaiA [Pirellulaceae bacterium]|nr:ribosome-associated translation inhibitor RaiA [Pirellulaceae bacterium]HMO93718.1 ribosome-associated translation inhibitor RaiA [Pirellulaceae bacterium]HMP69779.1 ribosome-associated translation inhibitor RaiA [Pirellulaceae bacterium]
MKITISSKNGQLPEPVQQSIGQKVSKLSRFFDRITGVDVIVNLKDTTNPSVEMVVTAEETQDFFANDQGTNVIAAFDGVMQKIESQLKKHKEKLTGHRNRTHKDSPA